MHLEAAGREGVCAPGDAVVEARTDAEHEVAVMHRPVGLVGAVHAEHAEPGPAAGRIGAKPHQRRGDGEAGQLGQFPQPARRLGAGVDDAAARIEDRALRDLQRLDRGKDGGRVALTRGL